MKRLILALFLVVLSVSISSACYMNGCSTPDCEACLECSTIFTWTTEGLPSPASLNSLLHQLLPVFNDVDCVTVQNAAGDCEVLSNPMDFTTFNYREFASSVCENTTLKFYDCDGGTNTVPIPSTLFLLGSGIAGILAWRRKDE